MESWYIKEQENNLINSIFLIEIGKIIISKKLKENNKEKQFNKLLKKNKNINKTEKEIIGLTSSEVTYLILKKWNFEKNLIDIIKNCDTPENAITEENKRIAMIIKVIRTCININNAITEDSLKKSKELIKKYNLNLQNFEKAIELKN